jgi:hypothetical protein
MLYISKIQSNISKENEKLTLSDVDADQEMIDVQSKVTTDERYAQQVGIYETLQVLCGGIEALNDDVQRLRRPVKA